MAEKKPLLPVGDYAILIDATSVMRTLTIRAEARIRIGLDKSILIFPPSHFAKKGVSFEARFADRDGEREITLRNAGGRTITISTTQNGGGEMRYLYCDYYWPWRHKSMPIIVYPDFERVLKYLESL